MSDYVERIGSTGCGWGTSMARGDAEKLGRVHYRTRTVMVVRDYDRWVDEQSEDNIKFYHETSVVVDMQKAFNDPVYAMTMVWTLANEAAKMEYNQVTDSMNYGRINEHRKSKGWDPVEDPYAGPSKLAARVNGVIGEISSHWMADVNGIFDNLWLPGGVPNLDHPVQKALWAGEI